MGSWLGWAMERRWGSLTRSPPGSEHLLRLSQALHEGLEKAIRLVAIHYAMVDGQRHVAAGTNDDTIFAVVGCHHHRTLLQLSNSQDGRLRLVDDDGSGDEAAADAVIGDGEGATADIRWRQVSFTSSRHEIVESLSLSE